MTSMLAPVRLARSPLRAMKLMQPSILASGTTQAGPKLSAAAGVLLASSQPVLSPLSAVPLQASLFHRCRLWLAKGPVIPRAALLWVSTRAITASSGPATSSSAGGWTLGRRATGSS
ncbi:hypothetical protein D3C80_1692450 [compost metagenome]